MEVLTGVILILIGGLASASFYVPFRKVKGWAWETYWLVGGLFSWIIGPWVLALIIVGPHTLMQILQETPGRSIFWAYFFGVLWGVGGLTFGLSVRYLGIGLGIAIALGFCAAFGEIIPAVIGGTFGEMFKDKSGQVVLLGILTCLIGIGINGLAGMFKEKDVTEEQKKEGVKEFNFGKGVFIAVFAGIMSACMALGLNSDAAGKAIANTAETLGVKPLWLGLPVLVVVLLGGFTTNFIWCVMLNIKNRTGRDYLSPVTRDQQQVPLLSNYVFSAIAGTTWYMQFFFYKMGESKMGTGGSWIILMASIIVLSAIWGVCLNEWKGATKRTALTLVIGLIVLVGSIAIVGYGKNIPKPAKTELPAAISTAVQQPQ
jgi:L-rhamnose-H+ transport protein